MKKRNGCIITLLIIVIIGAAMIVTCPNTQAHKEKLSAMVSKSGKEAVSQDMNAGNDLVTQGLQLVGNILVNKMVDSAVDNMLQVENYIVCSIGRVSYSGDEHIGSLGLLGHIFTMNQDKLNEATRKQYESLRDKAIGDVTGKVKETIEPITNKIVEGIAGEIGNVIRDVISGSEPEEDGQSSR